MSKVYNYLKQLSNEEKAPKKEIQEYYCKTCKLSADPMVTQYFVDRTPDHCKIYIVPKFRKTIPLGIIFTRKASIARPHFEGTAQNHKWGEYQPNLEKP